MPGARVPQDLDRNIALDLVRVTEAAAMAAGRWVGRGDKNGGDGAAVDAMRKLINSIQMRGVVVIGEGEKDNAPMLFNGEQVGDGTGPEVDVAVDPVDGTTLMSKGMPGRGRGAGRRRARRDVRPERRLLHGEARGRPGLRRRRSTSTPARRRTCAGSRRPRGPASPTSPSASSTGRGTTTLVEEVRDAGASIRFISDGDIAGAISAARERVRRRRADGHRRHPGGHHRRVRAEVPGRHDPGQAVAAGRRRTREGASPAATTWTAC